MKVLVEQYDFEIGQGGTTYIGVAYVMYEEEVKLVVGLEKKITAKGEEKFEGADLRFCADEIECYLRTGQLKDCTGKVEKVFEGEDEDEGEGEDEEEGSV